METALINTLRAQPAFGGFAVAPRLPDGGRAVGVRLDPTPPLGSLSRGRVTVTIVCPRDDDDHCRALVDAVLAWRATREFTASDRAIRRTLARRFPTQRWGDDSGHEAAISHTAPEQ